MYKLHTRCRACGFESLESVFDLGVTALANDFQPEDGDHAGYAPLKVMFCRGCTLAQLSVVVNPKVLYESYAYETSKSKTMRAHFEALWQTIKTQGKVDGIIEIGSNDGAFLTFAKENGAESVVGIDPALNLGLVATRNMIPNVRGVLDRQTASYASAIVHEPDVIIARHVFCHINDWREFIDCVDAMSRKNTLVLIEVPYVVETLQRTEWDQVYHEHLSYLSLRAMAALLDGTSLRMQHVMRFSIHGGAIVVFLRRRDWNGDPDSSVASSLNAEIITPDVWANFSARASDQIDRLRELVRGHNRSGKKVVGYGASAKSTVCISACGFTKKDIAYICDSTPWKQGRLSPGTDIPIVPESEFTNETADVAICFAWNFMPEIKEKNAAWISRGGKFIDPHVPDEG